MLTFKREERLRSKKAIDELFTNGYKFNVYPFTIFWKYTEANQPYPVSVLVSVSKRNHKKAVTRNYLKRRIKESFRLRKNTLYKELSLKNKKIHLAIIYGSKEMQTFHQIDRQLERVIQELIKRC